MNIQQEIADIIALEFRDDPASPGEINYTFACHVASALVAELGLQPQELTTLDGILRWYATRVEHGA